MAIRSRVGVGPSSRRYTYAGFESVLQIEFDLTVLAAVLAVIGYSLNDTIVVCDRIRENFRKIRKGEPVEIINISLTQTLNRTIITSLTTVLVLVALFYALLLVMALKL